MKRNTIRRTVAIMLSLVMLFGFMPNNIMQVFADETVVIFQFNDGDKANAVVPFVAGKALASTDIPTPTREGYTFAGWYKVNSGDLQGQAYNVSVNYGRYSIEAFAESTTLYAQWIEDDHVRLIKTTDGDKTTVLGISTFSGVEIRTMDDANTVVDLDEEDLEVVDGTLILDYGVYKDLNGNGELNVYEDWRQSTAVRAADLAKDLSTKEIAGLMLYSGHQSDWNSEKPGLAQITFLANDDLRHVLIAGAGSTADLHANWNNSVQAMSEKFGNGIPANNSSDPRHSAAIGVEFYSNNDGTMSIWPTSLGLAATFDAGTMFQFGKIASAEYRAFGISTALSPQIDIATDPRWNRTSGTFGEDPRLSADMAAAYVKGFQGTYADNLDSEDADGKWGSDSVNAMIKHWPGGGAGESGRDAHNDLGKYAIFPSRNFQAHMIPFVDGSLKGDAGSVDVATAVMPYYTISNNVDPTGTDVANGFSEYMLSELLVGKYGFEGVICTDWGVDTGRGWGPSIEDMTTSERSYELIMAGINQFGGQNTTKYILEAEEIALEKETEEEFEAKMKISAGKLLLNVFNTGLFENAYLDPDVSKAIAADPDNNAAGVEAQVKALVTLKNTTGKQAVVKSATTKVYVPKDEKGKHLFTNKGIDSKEKFVFTDNPSEADIAIVPLGTPTNPGAPGESFFGGGFLTETGYFPLSLQYSEYTAVNGREISIGGDYRDKAGTLNEKGEMVLSPSILNRTYKDKTGKATNFASFKTLMDTKEAMGDKPVVAVLNVDNPTVMTEIDAVADVIIARFACSDAAILEILTGNRNTTGMLPLQFPASMAAVEKQMEDKPRDLEVYKDSQGNSYDFGYGLTWDNAEEKYKVIDASVNKGYKKYVNNGVAEIVPMTKPASEIDNGIDDIIEFETIELPIGTVGKAYSAEIKTNSETAKVELLRVEKNEAGKESLLAGLSFIDGTDGTATISGTPTEAGEIQIVIKASADGTKGDRIYRLNLLVNETQSVKHADPNELSMQLTLASAKKEENYKPEVYSEFTIAYKVAKEIYAMAIPEGGFKTNQATINKAAEKLKETIVQLEEARLEVPIVVKSPDVKATKTTNTITLTWDAVSNEDYAETYVVYIKSGDDYLHAMVPVIANGKATATITGLSSDTTYTFKVTAKVGTMTADSEPITVRTDKVTSGNGGSSGGGQSITPDTKPKTKEEIEATKPPTGTIVKPQTLLESKFKDASSIPSWATSAIETLVTSGVISGRANGTFDPNGNVTRAEFVSLIVNGFDIKTQGAEAKVFADVASGTWYKSIIDLASSNGLANGIGGGLFAPDNNITRQDLCVMVYNALNTMDIELPEIKSSSFNDGESISAYAKNAVGLLNTLGIVNGRPNGGFDPQATATRAEAAVIIKGVLDFMAE